VSARDNQEQIDYWNGAAGERWARGHDELERALSVFGRAALDQLGVAPGERVLDVGCGAGDTVLELLTRVGGGGAVVGVDLSHQLLELARARTAGQSRVSFLQADAARVTFDAPFDALFSRFGVMFFSDPVAAFQNLRRALVPGGRMGFVCWQALADNPWAALPLTVSSPLLTEPPPAPDPEAPGPFAFAAPARIQHVLAGAGFTRAEVTAFRAPVLMSEHGVEPAVDFALRVGPVARLMANQSDAVRERARRELTAVLGAEAQAGRVTLDGQVWLVSARA
jgi:SAM-dependent methyltransferase